MRKDTWKASVASLVGVTSEDRHLPFLLLPLLAMEKITPLLPTCPVCVLHLSALRAYHLVLDSQFPGEEHFSHSQHSLVSCSSSSTTEASRVSHLPC